VEISRISLVVIVYIDIDRC